MPQGDQTYASNLAGKLRELMHEKDNLTKKCSALELLRVEHSDTISDLDYSNKYKQDQINKLKNEVESLKCQVEAAV